MSALWSLLHNAARWLFLAALVYAPWAYGCTIPWTVRGLNWILAVALGAQGASYVVSRQRSEVRGQRRRRRTDSQEPITNNATAAPWALIAPSVLLLALGWWMAFNARWIYDSDFFLFVPRRALVGIAPGSVDFTISAAWMVRATLLLGVVFFAATLWREPVWLMRLWWTVALAGGSIALLGLIQKAMGAPMIFWEHVDVPVQSFFATYYAHGNAGSYLNLVFPLSAGLALRGFLRKGSHVARAVALVMCLLVMVAIVSNTSRGGQAVGLVIVVGLVVCFR